MFSDDIANVSDRATILREQAQALVLILASRADEAESLRRLPDETLDDVKAAGLHRMCQPRRFGGAEVPLDAAVDIVSILARGCAATAWVCGVYNDHSIVAGMCDPGVPEEIWGENPDAVIAAGFFPSGNAEPVEGGWRLTGKWGFSSGCDFADWLLLGSMLPIGDGDATPSLCFVPRSEVRIDDNWQVMGLAGTGSKKLIVENTFVPSYRIISFEHARGGAEMRGRTDVAPLYRLPHISTVPFFFCGTALGIAESMLLDVTAEMKNRTSFGRPVAEIQTMQMHLAEASAEVECARLLVMRDTTEAMTAMSLGKELPLAERARNRRDMAYATQLCSQAVNRLFCASGGNALFLDNTIQRKYRDMSAVARHIAVNWDIAGTIYGRVAFGLDPASPLV